ncbi:MAG: hypothetical protein WC661_10285 [Opitutaceae bacterium]|jgi:hypothetical protein
MIPEIENELNEMLAELESNQLLIVLTPAPRPMHHGHMIRARAGQNPRWYRELCARFPSSRLRNRSLPDTRIRRRDTLATLRAMIGGGSRSDYALEILRIATRRLQTARRAA